MENDRTAPTSKRRAASAYHDAALLTDLYQLTMAQGYWQLGRADVRACFNLFFRRAPFGGHAAIACGLEAALDFVEHFAFVDEDLRYLRTLEGAGGRPLFDPAFLDSLASMRLEVDIDAVLEGELVLPREPMLRVEGPLMQVQLLETALLTHLNFPTLVATKAARVCAAAGSRPVLEFGLRRAQGVDGGVTASRSAYVGGCAATSNVLAGQRFDIPVKGTHAHSWVMAFPSERAAFEAYAEVMPHNCVLLVDTYDTIEGVKEAIEVAHSLAHRGHALAAIRLDSGDLAALSLQARALLDEAGLDDVQIVASDDLDETKIADLDRKGARIDVWGVGTRIATAYDEPALGGVYKLAAIADQLDTDEGRDAWRFTMKHSSDPDKASLPGRLQVRRAVDSNGIVYDQIFDLDQGPDDDLDTPPGAVHQDLLVPVIRHGRRVATPRSIHQARERARMQPIREDGHRVTISRALRSRRLELTHKGRPA